MDRGSEEGRNANTAHFTNFGDVEKEEEKQVKD